MSSPSRAFDPSPDVQLDMLSPSRAFDLLPDTTLANPMSSPSLAFDLAPDATNLDLMSPSQAFDPPPTNASLLDMPSSRALDPSMSPSRAFDLPISPSRAFDPLPDASNLNTMPSPSRAFEPTPDVVPERVEEPVVAEKPTAVQQPAAVAESVPEELAVVSELAVIEQPAAPEPEEPAAPETNEATAESPSYDSSGSEPGEIDEQSSPEPPSESHPESSKPTNNTAPPLPNEPLPGQTEMPDAPPLPNEPAPAPEDDGWEAHWNPNTSSFWFYNRFTSVWQQENPRVPDAPATAVVAPVVVPETQDKAAISNPVSVAGGYNPAIHGDYDENAWYAQNARAVTEPQQSSAVPTMVPHGEGEEYQYVNGAYFNRWTGQWQTPEQGPERHSDEAKSKRQLNAYFDVDAAANMHDGRSLKAERANRKLTKAELKAFKEKRKAKKEEKRRAWLRD